MLKLTKQPALNHTIGDNNLN